MNLKLFLGTTLAAAAVVMGGFAVLQISQDEANVTGNSPQFVANEPQVRLPGSPPSLFNIMHDRSQFTHRGGAAKLELHVDKGVTRTISIDIIPTEHLIEPAVFHVGLVERSGSPAGVDVSFSPEEFLVSPGETTSFVITIQVDVNAEEKATLFSYQITSDAFPGRRHAGFEILVGNASPIPRDMPLVEDIVTINESELDAYIGDGWEVVRDLGDGEYLMRRLVPANP